MVDSLVKQIIEGKLGKVIEEGKLESLDSESLNQFQKAINKEIKGYGQLMYELGDRKAVYITVMGRIEYSDLNDMIKRVKGVMRSYKVTPRKVEIGHGKKGVSVTIMAN